MLSEIRWRVGQFAVGPVGMAVRAFASPVAFGASALLIDRQGRVGLARHSYLSGLAFPGGGIGRGEPPAVAMMRELQEELGAVRSDPPVLVGLYTRPAGWATNVIALYRLLNCEVDFRPSLEVRELIFVDPSDPPAEATHATRRRLAEHCGTAAVSPYW
jgi:8-oxo-dGTP pyrophosphatase MutT (NUDIX family)